MPAPRLIQREQCGKSVPSVASIEPCRDAAKASEMDVLVASCMTIRKGRCRPAIPKSKVIDITGAFTRKRFASPAARGLNAVVATARTPRHYSRGRRQRGQPHYLRYDAARPWICGARGCRRVRRPFEWPEIRCPISSSWTLGCPANGRCRSHAAAQAGSVTARIPVLHSRRTRCAGRLRQRAVHAGVDGYLIKPVAGSVLVREVRARVAAGT